MHLLACRCGTFSLLHRMVSTASIHAVERTASQPTGSQVQATLLVGRLAVAHLERSLRMTSGTFAPQIQSPVF
jgi:hypothetical protein